MSYRDYFYGPNEFKFTTLTDVTSTLYDVKSHVTKPIFSNGNIALYDKFETEFAANIPTSLVQGVHNF